jgi:sulfhydrogenase subunit gamma (sulfur reductase)
MSEAAVTVAVGVETGALPLPGRAMVRRDALERWARGLMEAGARVVAPVVVGHGHVEYRELTPAAAEPDGLGEGLARLSPKDAWFPRSEPILKLRRRGKDWSVSDPDLEFPPVVVLGARPCDAAAPRVVAPLFGWDYHDPFFERRIRNVAFVVVACSAPVDDACFCTSVGVDPAGEGAGDVLLTEAEDGAFFAEARTPRGRELLAALPDDAPGAPRDDAAVAALRQAARDRVPRRFDRDVVRQALVERFDDPIWDRSSRSCVGCGTCAFICPTCHCFDIQDEVVGGEVVRQKNWDACAFPLFTLHTSGHNPRPTQATRWRQRLSHKFRYYPEKFGEALCTGCGRCLRLCPNGMDLLSDLEELSRDRARPVALRPPPSDAPATRAVPPAQIAAPLNVYRPYLMRVAAVRDEAPDVRTLRLEFDDAAEGEAFSFRVGQFGLYSAFGEGESTFCIASASTRKGYIECTFRQAGRVTRALRRLNVGDTMGFRGPYGTSFPVEAWRGKNLVFVAGGIALPPMRSVIQYCLDRREDYRDITIVYGARTSADHVYKDELAEWAARPDVNLWRCVDWKPGMKEPAPAEEGWRPLDPKNPGASLLDPSHRQYTGFVPQLVEAVKPSPADAVAVLCGPPVMIKFTLASLKRLGFRSDDVYTTLENRMKCGIGKCGRCNVGPIYVCKEGPVFTASEVEALPPEM